MLMSRLSGVGTNAAIIWVIVALIVDRGFFSQCHAEMTVASLRLRRRAG